MSLTCGEGGLFLKNKAVILTLTVAVTFLAVASIIIFAVYSKQRDNGSGSRSDVSDTTSSHSQTESYVAVKPTERATEKNIEKAATEAPTEKKEPATENVYEAPTMSVEISTDFYKPAPAVNPASPTEPGTSEATAKPTEVDTVPTEPAEPATEYSEMTFERLIARTNYSLDDINASGCGQMVVVDVYGAQANVYMFTLEDDVWKSENLKCTGWIGRNGAGEKQSVDDGITPTGFYEIGDAFFEDEQPSTWLNTFKITDNTYWVTDTESDMYNKKVEADSGEFEVAKHMIEDEALEYGCVIEYNTYDTDKSKGGAVFMECGDIPTDGGIAVTEADMLKYLNVLNATKKPHILIF